MSDNSTINWWASRSFFQILLILVSVGIFPIIVVLAEIATVKLLGGKIRPAHEMLSTALLSAWFMCVARGVWIIHDFAKEIKAMKSTK